MKIHMIILFPLAYPLAYINTKYMLKDRDLTIKQSLKWYWEDCMR